MINTQTGQAYLRENGNRDNRRTAFSLSSVTGATVNVLRQGYSTQEHITDPLIRDCVWRPGDDTGILIEPVTSRYDNRIQKRPAIIVKRSALESIQLSSANRVSQFGTNVKEAFVKQFKGKLVLFCAGDNPAQAEAIAGHTFQYLLHFSDIVRNTLKLNMYQVSEIGEIGKLDEAGETFAVPVGIDYKVELSWQVQADSVPFRKMQVAMEPITSQTYKG